MHKVQPVGDAPKWCVTGCPLDVQTDVILLKHGIRQITKKSLLAGI
jgi:hypothetical protein